MIYYIIFHQEYVCSCIVNLRPVFFDPHHFRNTVHLMCSQTGDSGKFTRTKFFCQSFAFFFSTWICIKHGCMKWFTIFICHNKSFSETGHTDSGNVRIFFCHFCDYCINPIHDRRYIYFMSADTSADRIIFVCFIQIPALFIKHRTFTTGRSYIQSCNFHIIHS